MRETYYAMNPWWEAREAVMGIPRPTYLSHLRGALARTQVELVMGGRRVGKTTLAKQFVGHCLGEGIPPQEILYLALDHPRLASTPISEHLRAFRALFGHERKRKLWVVFDEVQDSPDWGAELKALHDLENVKIVCTGSTSALLASQGGRLTGRQAVLTVYPLSFEEFLAFRDAKPSRAEEYRFAAAADEYLQTGGYPEQVLNPAGDTYLAQLLQDIVSRDLIRLGRVRRPEAVHDLLRLLAAGVGSRTSHNRLAKTLGLSPDTVKDYLSYLEQAYLTRALEKWATSYNERVYAARKVYLLDTGMKTLLTGSGDMGAKAETAVFSHLLRQQTPCGYYAESEREVDFVMGEPGAPVAVEVKYDSTFTWENRRLDGLRLFLRRFPACHQATVVTRDASAQLIHGGCTVTAIPLWQYLLQSQTL